MVPEKQKMRKNVAFQMDNQPFSWEDSNSVIKLSI